MTATFNLIGIDPGAVNLGYAELVTEDIPFKITAKFVATYNVREFGPANFVDKIKQRIDDYWRGRFDYLTIERFVPYAGVQNDVMEEVNQTIGMLRYGLGRGIIDTELLRAVEWKTQLVKLLNKHCGFENPSKTGALDKQFSLAVAKFITTNPDQIKNDHEADAVCLGAFPYIKQCAAQRERERERERKQLRSQSEKLLPSNKELPPVGSSNSETNSSSPRENCD